MWPFDHVFATYRWWGPLGYYARNFGNIAAGFAQVAIAALLASVFWPPARRAIHRFVDTKLAPIHAHLRWHAELAAIQHKAITGQEPPPHPVHGVLPTASSPVSQPPVRSHHKKPSA